MANQGIYNQGNQNAMNLGITDFQNQIKGDQFNLGRADNAMYAKNRDDMQKFGIQNDAYNKYMVSQAMPDGSGGGGGVGDYMPQNPWEWGAGVAGSQGRVPYEVGKEYLPDPVKETAKKIDPRNWG
jgi:hypothetical protein